MPFVTLDITGDGTGNAVTTGTPTGEGNVYAVCAFVKDGSTPSGNTQIEIALTAAPNNPLLKTAVLVDDYVYDTHSPAWDGNMWVQSGEGLQVTIRSFDTATIRVVLKYMNHGV